MQRREAFNPFTGDGELELKHCGYEQCRPGFYIKKHMRSCYLIHYIVSGRGFFEQGGRRYEVGPGDWFIIYPGHLVSYYCPDPELPWCFAWFGFIGSGATEIVGVTGATFEHPVGKLRNERQFLSTLKQCTDTLHEEKQLSNTWIKSCLYQLLYLLERPELYEPRMQQDRQTLLYREALSYISFNYNRPMSVLDLAVHLNIDRTYLWKIFHHYSGMSPQRYVMRVRIDKAAELLRNSELTLSEVAQCVGIADLYYFSRLFKKLKGMSPSRYRCR